MKMPFKHLQFLTLGVFLLSSSVFAAAKECYSTAELNDFKTLYIKLQQQLNYEGKDAYLDKNFQVKLKPHSKDQDYPGKAFEAALFSEYQNSLKKVAKLYQSAKFDNDDSFKSNDVLVNFMKAIDDKSTESQDFISKTKIKDVIDALETESQKKFSRSGDKKFVINSGDKYLLEKLLIHAQDRVCSVGKYESTNKDTPLFKADYLKQVKNAPLNVLINTIKNAPIEKDSKIELKPASDLVGSLVDSDVAVQSAVADNLNQLSAWVKKVKAQGPNCLASIKNKTFANQIQSNIQGCNFGHFIETLSQDNVNNLESVLHFINANEKLLNNPAAKAETGLDELKLEGFVSKTFDNLGTAVRCTVLDPANSGDKKIFIRNLPYNEKSNKFDTSGIICKSNAKILGADSCSKQFDLTSDSLGRGLEIKPKKGAASQLTFSVKDSDNCSDIALLPSNSGNLATTADQCSAQLKDGSAFVWDTKASKCNEVEISKVSSLEQCVALTKEGSVFNWDSTTKSCGEFSAMLAENVLKQAAQQCSSQKKNGYAYKWDTSKKSCDEIPTTAGTKFQSKIACDAKRAANLPFKWNTNENTCESSPALSAQEQKDKAACESKPSKSGFISHYDLDSLQCSPMEVSKVSSIEQCVNLKKPGSVFNWDESKKSCGEFSALLSQAALKQAAQQCSVKGTSFKWNAESKECLESSSSSKDLSKISSIEQCSALTKQGSVFNWDANKKLCIEQSALLSNAVKTQTAQQCMAQKKNGYEYKWDSESNVCRAIPTVTGTKFESKIACDAKVAAGLPFKWNTSESICESSIPKKDETRTPAQSQGDIAKLEQKNNTIVSPKNSDEVIALAEAHPVASLPDVNEKMARTSCESKSAPGTISKWNSISKSCETTKSSQNDTGKKPVIILSEGPKTTTPAVVGSKAPSNNASTITPSQRPTIPSQKSTGSLETINLPEKSGQVKSDTTIAKPPSTPASSPQVNCEEQSKEGFVYKWLPDSKLCLEEEVSVAKLNCESQKKEGFEYKWMADSAKCLEEEKTVEKSQEEQKPEAKKDEAKADDKSSDDGEKQCEIKNNEWIEKSNDGRPGIRYEWDGKECKDKRPDKEGPKKVAEEEHEEMEAATPMKRAPARFVPINIPSRQIYLMPGMP